MSKKPAFMIPVCLTPDLGSLFWGGVTLEKTLPKAALTISSLLLLPALLFDGKNNSIFFRVNGGKLFFFC
jgi:hypothetical protein